ncbi:MAG: hypothetical protein UT44_C0003G0008 [Candidatus Levybacteria bacterium GW2011_GWA1_39_32]|nr:MAG: hypothetical protein UT44_C0003G0008 [Candidatus Levybacteria bacterium GW2011_GWA1_39_32]
MNGKEKLYFLLDAIDDARTIAPSGQPLKIDPMNDLNGNFRDVELSQLFAKLEKDERVLKVLKASKRANSTLGELDPDPYDHADDGCWHIKLLPAFDSYFLKIQQELEYQEFTGKKPAGSQTKPNSNAVMTYEEKLDLIVKAVVEASKTLHKGFFTATLYLNATNGLDRLPREEIRNILLQLQDEKALKVHPLNNRLLPPNQQPTHYFLLDIPEFHRWHSNYLIQRRTSIENLTESNLNEIYLVLTQIEEQLQIVQSDKINFSFVSSFHDVEGYDTSDIDDLTGGYIKVLDYLKKIGVIIDYLHREMSLDAEITLNINSYYDLLDKVKAIKSRGNKLVDKPVLIQKNENQQITTKALEKTNKSKISWQDDFRWEGNSFVFGTLGKIDFNSEDRRHIFKALTDKKGGWATINEMKGNKDVGYVRSTIKQIEDRMPEEAKKKIIIVSTQDDNAEDKPAVGAYRIKILPKP